MKKGLEKSKKRAAPESDNNINKKKTKTRRMDSPTTTTTTTLGNDCENSSIDTTTSNVDPTRKKRGVQVEADQSLQELRGLSRSVEKKQNKRKRTTESDFPPAKPSKINRTSPLPDDETSNASTAQIVERIEQSLKKEASSTKKKEPSKEDELDHDSDCFVDIILGEEESSQYHSTVQQVSTISSHHFAETLHGGAVDCDGGDEDDFWFSRHDAWNMVISLTVLCLIFAMGLRWISEHEQFLQGKVIESDGEIPVELTRLLHIGNKLEQLKFH